MGTRVGIPPPSSQSLGAVLWDTVVLLGVRDPHITNFHMVSFLDFML